VPIFADSSAATDASAAVVMQALNAQSHGQTQKAISLLKAEAQQIQNSKWPSYTAHDESNRLKDEALNQIHSLINELSKNPTPPSNSTSLVSKVATTLQAPLNAIADDNSDMDTAALIKAMSEHPEARKAMVDLTLSNVEDKAAKINDLSKQLKGYYGPEWDAIEQSQMIADQTVDPVFKLFMLLGISVSVQGAQNDLAIVERENNKHDIDQTADLLIREAVIKAATVGAVTPLSNLQTPILKGLGLSVQGYFLLRMTSKLIQDLAMLYDHPIVDSLDLETYMGAMLALGGLYTQYSGNDLTAKMAVNAADVVGKNMALMGFKDTAVQARSFFKAFFKNPKIAKMIKASPAVAEINQGTLGSFVPQGALPTLPTQPAFPPLPTIPGTSGGSLPPPQPLPQAPSMPMQQPTQPFPQQNAGPSFKPSGLPTPGKAILMVGTSVRDAATAAALMGSIGLIAKKVGQSALRESLKQRDISFYTFLEGKPQGEAFLNLLITVTQAAHKPVTDLDFDKSSDKRVIFIRNLAHAAHFCSALDVVKAQQIVRNSKASKTPLTFPQQILVSDCANRFNTDAYNRLKNNFVNFKDILTDDDSVVALRLTERSNRLKMAELVVQMQWLNEDRGPQETLYFEKTVAKILGMDSPQIAPYFYQYDSYISSNHFLKESPSSPTGYAVIDEHNKSPYDETPDGFGPDRSGVLNAVLPTYPGQTYPGQYNGQFPLPSPTPFVPGQTYPGQTYPGQTQPLPGQTYPGQTQPQPSGQLPAPVPLPQAPGQVHPQNVPFNFNIPNFSNYTGAP
jgi:hypothetical protein